MVVREKAWQSFKAKIAVLVTVSLVATGAIVGGTIYGVTRNKGLVKLET